MSQRAARLDTGHPHGVHLHSDVLHLPEQRGDDRNLTNILLLTVIVAYFIKKEV